MRPTKPLRPLDRGVTLYHLNNPLDDLAPSAITSMTDRTDSESIKALTEDIERSRLFLPEFQRDFKWDIKRTYDLFDSLVRDVFIGALIYGIPSFAISVREIDNRKRIGKNRGDLRRRNFTKKDIDAFRAKNAPPRLILDGQQRITALYRAMKGSDDVWYIAREVDNLDLRQRPTLLEDCLQEFSGRADEDRLSILISDVWRMVTQDIKRESEKRDLLRASPFVRNLAPSPNRFEELFGAYLSLSDALVDLVKSDKLLNYYLLDTSVEKFALFFERSNSRGLRLTFTDILAAKLYSGFDLRSERDSFADENPTIELDEEHAVRVIAFLQSGGAEIKQPWILQNLEAAHFARYWKHVTRLYVDVVNFLVANHWIASQALMPYDNMIVPIMLFTDALPSAKLSQATPDQLTFLSYWYWSSLFSERYSAKTNETILSDAALLRDVAGNVRNIDSSGYSRTFVSQIPSAEVLVDIDTPTSALFKSVLSLVHYSSGGSKDWKNGQTLSSTDKLESHHIFPKKFLSSAYKGLKEHSSLVDSVANRAYVSKITNIKIGAKAPSGYLAELLREGNAKLGKTLDSHLIPSGLLAGTYDKDFVMFLRDRSKRILTAVRSVTDDVAVSAIGPFARPAKSKRKRARS